MLEPRSFDVYKNTIAPMIVILGYLEVNIEVSDIGIETMESNDCREIIRNNKDDRDVNS